MVQNVFFSFKCLKLKYICTGKGTFLYFHSGMHIKCNTVSRNEIKMLPYFFMHIQQNEQLLKNRSMRVMMSYLFTHRLNHFLPSDILVKCY